MTRIKKLLVANRGEIARRIFATCRRMGIATVAVYSDPDRREPFVAEADEGFALGGSTAAESYLRIDRLIEAASATGADAIHPGYGFLAENAEFARAVNEAGLTWVGPSPRAIETMGSKLASKELMGRTGVPTLAGQDLTGMSGAAAVRAAEEIGYPVLVKASAGGGGKGMQIVYDPDALSDAVNSAGRQAEAAFGDDDRLPGAVFRGASPHRDPGVCRHPRQHRVAVRTGVLDSAPTSEDHRGGAFFGHRRAHPLAHG